MSSNYFTGLMVVFIVMLTLTAVGLADTPVQYEIDFTANTTSGFVPLEVLFTDTSTVPGEVISRYWDFGDGTDVPGPELSVIHIYTSPGLYSVRMDRTDDEGVHSRVKFDYITAEESPPPTPTTPPTTIPTTGPTTQPTTTPTTGPTTGPTTSPTTSPTTIPTTGPTTQPTTSPTTVPTTGTSHPPAEFRGTVTVSGSPAQPGSIITGTIGGIERGRITTSISGIYGGSGPFDERLRIYATDEDLSGGNPVIRFTVNGYDADQAVLFVEGSSTRLDLTAAGPVTPTTSPTTAPTTGPTTQPTTSPTTAPTTGPTTQPTTSPTTAPTTGPTTQPTTSPTTAPTTVPTTQPTPPGPADLYISLWPGWNFVSVPMVLEEGFNTAGIFHDVDTRGHGIFSYNASSMRWLQMNRTTLLTPAGSLWIYSANSMQVPLHFSKNQTKQDITLMKGWNGLGITGNSSSQAKNAFSPLGDNWSYAMGFNSISQQYEISIINGGSGSHSDTRQVYPTHGYWILMAENMTFKPFP